jgi:hypothetical protein
LAVKPKKMNNPAIFFIIYSLPSRLTSGRDK